MRADRKSTYLLLDREYYLNVYTGRSQWDRPIHDAEEDTKLPKKVQCLHILVKHSKSRNPSSWRTENITRSKEEARKILKGWLFRDYFFVSCSF
jgi:NIMA-interacting peptidyl-prolyl cis-trans isomerase 1